jgi:hypothetical protein
MRRRCNSRRSLRCFSTISSMGIGGAMTTIAHIRPAVGVRVPTTASERDSERSHQTLIVEQLNGMRGVVQLLRRPEDIEANYCIARRGHLRPVASGAGTARHCALAAGGKHAGITQTCGNHSNMRESLHVVCPHCDRTNRPWFVQRATWRTSWQSVRRDVANPS